MKKALFGRKSAENTSFLGPRAHLSTLSTSQFPRVLTGKVCLSQVNFACLIHAKVEFLHVVLLFVH